MKQPISAVIIAYNEAHIIAHCLKALQWCDEIVVVDSGSQDDTVAICESLGAQVVYKKFEGFGAQKRFAVAQARHDWILSIDADEVLSEALIEEIQAIFRQGNISVQGFQLRRTLVFMNRPIRSEYGKPYLRLFDRRVGNFDEAKVHEQVVLPGKSQTLKNHFWHYSYTSIQAYFERFNKYTSMAAEELLARGKGKSRLMIVLRLPFSFLKIYFLEGCFLSGFPGFVWALFSAFYPVVKYVKVIDLKNPLRIQPPQA